MLPHKGRDRPLKLQKTETPRSSRQQAHEGGKVVGSPPPRPIYPRVKRTGTHCIRVWVGTRAGLDGYTKSRPLQQGSNRGPSSPQRVAIPTKLSQPRIVLVKMSSYWENSSSGHNHESKFQKFHCISLCFASCRYLFK
jgi:hypothetical protein